MENPPKQSVQDWFQYELEKLIEKYQDTGITLGECIGVLEIVKHDVIQGQKNGTNS